MVDKEEVEDDLRWAARAGDLEEAQIALDTPGMIIDITAPDQGGNTALHMASANGHLDIVKLILKRLEGTKQDSLTKALHAVNESGATPLHWAAVNGQAAVAETLIAAGASIKIKDSFGETPLAIAGRGSSTAALEVIAAAAGKEEEVRRHGSEQAQALVKRQERLLTGIRVVTGRLGRIVGVDTTKAADAATGAKSNGQEIERIRAAIDAKKSVE